MSLIDRVLGHSARRNIAGLGLLYAFYAVILYMVRAPLANDDSETNHGFKVFIGFASFLLIFRLNHCYERYSDGVCQTENLMTHLRCLLAIILIYTRAEGDKEDTDTADHMFGALFKVDCARYVLAIARSVKFHVRICALGPLSKEALVKSLLDIIGVSELLTADETAVVMASAGLWEEVPSDDPAEPSGRQSRARRHDSHGFLSSLNPFNRSSFLGGYIDDDGDGILSRMRRYYSSSEMFRDMFESDGILSRLNRYSPVGAYGHMRPVIRIQDPHPQFRDIQPTCIFVLLSQMLRSCVYRGTREPWGIPDRCLSLYEGHLEAISSAFHRLDRLVTVPQPSAYTQLCHTVIIYFLFSYPFQLNPEHGFTVNVIHPTSVAVALIGMAVVSNELENPIGDDNTDLDLLEMVHALEVEAEQLFNLSERLRCKNWAPMGQHELATSFGFDWARLHVERDRERKVYAFSDFFRWAPLPAQTVLGIMERQRAEQSLTPFERSRRPVTKRDKKTVLRHKSIHLQQCMLDRLDKDNQEENGDEDRFGENGVCDISDGAWHHCIVLRTEHANRLVQAAKTLDTAYPHKDIHSLAEYMDSLYAEIAQASQHSQPVTSLRKDSIQPPSSQRSSCQHQSGPGPLGVFQGCASLPLPVAHADCGHEPGSEWDVNNFTTPPEDASRAESTPLISDYLLPQSPETLGSKRPASFGKLDPL